MEEKKHEEGAQEQTVPPTEDTGGWGWGGGWGWSSSSFVTALSEKANQFVAAIVDDEDEQSDTNRDTNLKDSTDAKQEDTRVNPPNTEIEEPQEEEDESIDLEKSIWGAVSYISNAIQSAPLYDELAKSAQAIFEGAQETSNYQKGMDLSFSTLEAVGKKAADMLAIEVDPAQAGLPPPATSAEGQPEDHAEQPRDGEKKADDGPSTFDANFDECLGGVNLQALEDISTQSLISVGQLDSGFKAGYVQQLTKIQQMLEEEEEEEEEPADDAEDADGGAQESPREAKQAALSKEIDELQQKITLNRKARTKKKMAEAFATAALAVGPMQVTELEAALKALATANSSKELHDDTVAPESAGQPKESEEGPSDVPPTEDSGEAPPPEQEPEGKQTEKEGRSISAHDITALVCAHMDRCFTKSMMILSEYSASAVELFLRIGESYLAETQKIAAGDDKDGLIVGNHVRMIVLLRKHLANEVAMISSSFVTSLNTQARMGQDLLAKLPEQDSEGENAPATVLDSTMNGHVQEIYTNHAAKCHSHLHDSAKQFVGICQLLLLKHEAKS